MKVICRHPHETLGLDPEITEVTQIPKSKWHTKSDPGEGSWELSVE